LFYPDSADELRLMLKVMAKKVGVPVEDGATGPELAIPHVGQLSGADIEGVITRAARQAGIAGEAAITRERLEASLADFIPSAQSLEKRLQVAAAILECTDVAFLPAALRGADRAALQQEMAMIKAQLRVS
jgi:hypothetical protein